MRVLLTGGGTAGHINPALAIAETVRINDPSAEIIFVGVKDGKENDLVPREGYRLYHVKSKGIMRSLAPSNIKAIFLAACSPFLRSTTSILDEFKPDIVIGTGGFVCWPIMAAAARRKIPTAVHESNALPGLAVKLLQKRIDRVWVNFEQTEKLLDTPKPIVRVGNPMRQKFEASSYESARRELGILPGQTLILSFGGSLGAEAINRAVVDWMQTNACKDPALIHVHASGKRDFEATQKRFEEAGLKGSKNCILQDYIYDMPTYMAAADVVISRAGAMTLSELALMKKACILIPSPNVADDHQYKNAKTLADANAAILVRESELAKGSLAQELTALIADRQKRCALAQNITAFADPNANARIWNQILEMLHRK